MGTDEAFNTLSHTINNRTDDKQDVILDAMTCSGNSKAAMRKYIEEYNLLDDNRRKLVSDLRSLIRNIDKLNTP